MGQVIAGSDVAALRAATTLQDVAYVARTAMRRRLNCAGATVVLRDGDKCFYADEDSIAPLWAGQRFPIDECVSGWAMTHDEPAVIDDIDQDERVPLEAYRSTFVRSLVIVPIEGDDGRAAAALGAYWARTDEAGRADLAWLQGLADAVSARVREIGLGAAPWAPNWTARTEYEARPSA